MIQGLYHNHNIESRRILFFCSINANLNDKQNKITTSRINVTFDSNGCVYVPSLINKTIVSVNDKDSILYKWGYSDNNTPLIKGQAYNDAPIVGTRDIYVAYY